MKMAGWINLVQQGAYSEGLTLLCRDAVRRAAARLACGFARKIVIDYRWALPLQKHSSQLAGREGYADTNSNLHGNHLLQRDIKPRSKLHRRQIVHAVSFLELIILI